MTEAMMLDRIVEVFWEGYDFCQAFVPQWGAALIGTGGPARRGPEPGLSPSEIITLLLVFHSSGFKYLKSFYHAGQSGEARIFLIQDDNLTAEVPLRRSILQSTLRQKYRSTGRHNPQRDGGPEKGLYRLHPIALATGPHAGRHPRRPGLVLQIADIIDTDDGVACIADWFIASGVRLAQDVGLSEVAFALRNRRDGFSLWVENGANCPRSVVLLNVCRHADEVGARGRRHPPQREA